MIRPPGATVGVNPPIVVASAPGVRLRAAAPNPFRAGTTLAYELDAGGPVWLGIYDAGGRRVRALLRGAHVVAGAHAASWDGRDEAGREAPSGVYFQHLKTSLGSATQRIVRIR